MGLFFCSPPLPIWRNIQSENNIKSNQQKYLPNTIYVNEQFQSRLAGEQKLKLYFVRPGISQTFPTTLPSLPAPWTSLLRTSDLKKYTRRRDLKSSEFRTILIFLWNSDTSCVKPVPPRISDSFLPGTDSARLCNVYLKHFSEVRPLDFLHPRKFSRTLAARWSVWHLCVCAI